MAKDVLGYETGQLGISGLSNTERVRAPRAEDTRVATSPRDTRPNSWDSVSQVLASSVNIATNGFNMATKAHMMKEKERKALAKELEVTSEKKTKSASTGLSNRYTKFLNGISVAMGNTGAEDYTADDWTTQKQSGYLREFIGAETDSIKGNKELTADEQEKVLNYLDKMVSKDVQANGKKIHDEYKSSNIKELERTSVAKMSREFQNADFKLSDVLEGNTELNVAMLKNGGQSTNWDNARSAIGTLRFREDIIGMRFDEAHAEYQKHLAEGKEIPPGFADYFGDLTKYKGALETIKTKQDNKINAERSNAANEEIDLLMYDGNATPALTFGLGGIRETTLDATMDATKEAFRTQYASLFKTAGLEGVKLEKWLDKYTTKTVGNHALTVFQRTQGHTPNMDTMPKEMQTIVSKYVADETRASLEEGHPGVTNNLYAHNPKEVTKVVKPYIGSMLDILQRTSDPEKFEAIKGKMFGSLSGLDNGLISTAIDSKTQIRLDIISSFGQEEAMATLANLKAGTDYATTSDLSKEEKTFINELPYEEQQKATEAFLMQKTAFGTVKLEDYEKRIESRTYDGSVLTRGVADLFPSTDKTNSRSIMMEFLADKSTVGGIPEGSHIEVVNGNVRVSNKGSIIRSKRLIDLQAEVKTEQTRRFNYEMWEKDEGVGFFEWISSDFRPTSGGFRRVGEEGKPVVNPFEARR